MSPLTSRCRRHCRHPLTRGDERCCPSSRLGKPPLSPTYANHDQTTTKTTTPRPPRHPDCCIIMPRHHIRVASEPTGWWAEAKEMPKLPPPCPFCCRLPSSSAAVIRLPSSAACFRGTIFHPILVLAVFLTPRSHGNVPRPAI